MGMMESKRITVATAWLDGCSGCHMSFLDIDERLFALAEKVDIIYSPLVDTKTLPESVDVGILEGSVSTEEDVKKAQEFRRHCKFLISLGDCAVCGNVPGMRNFFPLSDVLDRAYLENVQKNPQIPTEGRARRCCPRSSRCTGWSMWICSCRAARRRRTRSGMC